MTQHAIRVGGKKNGFDLIFDDTHVPSRSASLKTRARWAIGYVRRLLAGEIVSKRLLDQALHWIDELRDEAPEMEARRVARSVARLSRVRLSSLISGSQPVSRKLIDQAVRWIDEVILFRYGCPPIYETRTCEFVVRRGGHEFRCTRMRHSGRIHTILTKSRGYQFVNEDDLTSVRAS